jgi:acyl carrier protein
VIELPVEEVSVEADLVEDLELDSLARMEIAAALEDQYAIRIEVVELVGVSTLPELCRFVETKLGETGAP